MENQAEVRGDGNGNWLGIFSHYRASYRRFKPSDNVAGMGGSGNCSTHYRTEIGQQPPAEITYFHV